MADESALFKPHLCGVCELDQANLWMGRLGGSEGLEHIQQATDSERDIFIDPQQYHHIYHQNVVPRGFSELLGAAIVSPFPSLDWREYRGRHAPVVPDLTGVVLVVQTPALLETQRRLSPHSIFMKLAEKAQN